MWLKGFSIPQETALEEKNSLPLGAISLPKEKFQFEKGYNCRKSHLDTVVSL